MSKQVKKVAKRNTIDLGVVKYSYTSKNGRHRF